MTPAPLVASHARDLKLEDLVLLEMPLGVQPQALKSLRTVHHQAARLLATGMKDVEVSAIVGLSQSRICILKSDPAFKELLTHYAQREDERFGEVQERMKNLGVLAGEVLQERLIENPDEISTDALVRVLTASLDRGGHAPVSKSESKSISVVISPEELTKMKAEAKTINGTVIYRGEGTRTVAGELPQSPGTQLGEVIPLRPEGDHAAPGKGKPGEGA